MPTPHAEEKARAQAARDRESRRMARLYFAVFTSPEGAEVLQDLIDRVDFDGPVFVPTPAWNGDNETPAKLKDGRRSLIRDIKEAIRGGQKVIDQDKFEDEENPKEKVTVKR